MVAVLDSNSSPDGIAYPIPGNDDAMRAIHLYCDLVSGAVLDGLQAELAASGVDIGARRGAAGRGGAGRGETARRRADVREAQAPDSSRRSAAGRAQSRLTAGSRAASLIRG